jgi:hypothetical protein
VLRLPMATSLGGLPPLSLTLAVLASLNFALTGLVLTPSASAGQYHVYACRTPAGEPAPADGWNGESFGPWDRAEDTCSKPGGALVAALGDETAHPTDVEPASWIFTTPADDTMAGATLWRAGDADGGEVVNGSYEFWLAGASEFSIFDQCAFQFGCPTGVGDPKVPLSSANRVPVPAANLGSHLYAYAACGGEPHFECPAGKGDASGYAAVVYLYAADIVLEQPAGPSVSNVGGELANEPTVSGTSDLFFTASDPGAGVWHATFAIDGHVVQSTVPDENGGRCRNVGETTDGLPAFLYLQPCLEEESVDVPFDTTGLSNGEHHLVVTIFDAAGNSAPVLDKQIDVQNPVPAGVAPASSVKPGPGAKPGRRRLPRARVTLTVEPHKVTLRQRIHFSGRVLGDHLPGGGKLLLLEARLVSRTSHGRRRRGKWFGFAEPRAGPRGRYHGSYRFNVFIGPGEYELRVLAKAETGYPFSAGTSNVVRVRVT